MLVDVHAFIVANCTLEPVGQEEQSPPAPASLTQRTRYRRAVSARKNGKSARPIKREIRVRSSNAATGILTRLAASRLPANMKATDRIMTRSSGNFINPVCPLWVVEGTTCTAAIVKDCPTP